MFLVVCRRDLRSQRIVCAVGGTKRSTDGGVERNQDAAGQAIWGTLNQEGTAWVGRDNGHARRTPCPVSRDSSFPVRLCSSSTRNVLRGRVTGEKGLARHHGFAIQLLQ